MSPQPGWISTTVGASTDFVTGFPFASARFASSGVRLVRGSNVKRGEIDWSSDIERFWPAPEPGLRAFELKNGDVVIAMDGALVGRSYARISRADLPAYLVQRVARLRGRTVDQGLLYQWIGSRAFVRHVDDRKTHTAIPHISPADIREFALTVPESVAEQERIAEALSDADDLISGLERTIAKKRAIKQGMMQQLLTGKTRLPGFTEPWAKRTLGEVARTKTGARNNQDKTAGGRYPFFVRSATVERINSYSYDCEAILVPGEGGIGSIFHYINGKFEVHQRVYKISDFAPDVRGKFVYHFMRQYFGAHAMENSVKATVDSLRLPTFNNFELQLPSLDEQQAIVDALDDAEAELMSLQGRLEKARSIKTGMMQELLTGRTRLVAEDGAA